jgi:O-antigen/teichoic acid export membrane protein
VELKPVTNISSTQKLAGSLIAGKLLALIGTFAIPVFLTRFLSKADYGLYAQLYTVVMLLTVFFEFGISSNLFYYYPTAEQKEKRTYVFQTFILLLVFSGLAAMLLTLPEFRTLLVGKGDLDKHTLSIIILVVILIPTTILSPMYIVKSDHKTAIILPLIDVLLRACLIFIFVLVFPGINSVFNAMIVSALAILSFTLFYIFKEIGFEKLFVPINMRLLRNQIAYSLPFGMAASVYTFSRMFDKILCISYLSTSLYATYAIAFYGIPGIQQIYDSLAQVTIVRMTGDIQNGRKKEALRIFKKMVTKTYSFSVPAIFIVSLYAKKIIAFLFTDKFIDSTPLFRAYLGTTLIVMLGIGLILRASGETKIAFRAYLYSALISLPLTFILVKNYGLWGAMSGAIFSILGPMLFMLRKEIQIMDSTLKDFLPWSQMFFIIGISAIVFIPFLLVELFFIYGIFLSGIMAFLYLAVVSFFEMKNGLFILETDQINNILSKLGNKFGINISGV